MTNLSKIIVPDWPAPSNIEALTTTRLLKNQNELNLPSNPILLKQVHGAEVINFKTDMLETFSSSYPNPVLEGDGVFTSLPDMVCGVRTADCLPVLICDNKGQHVAAVHAGWKGIKAGVLEKAIHQFPVSPNTLLIWLGPCISQQNYEVREDMRNQFGPEDADAFETLSKGQYLCDLLKLAEHRLQKAGLQKTQIFKANLCTYQDEVLFDSYRRDSAREGGSKSRMMSLIWRKKLI